MRIYIIIYYFRSLRGARVPRRGAPVPPGTPLADGRRAKVPPQSHLFVWPLFWFQVALPLKGNPRFRALCVVSYPSLGRCLPAHLGLPWFLRYFYLPFVGGSGLAASYPCTHSLLGSFIDVLPESRFWSLAFCDP